MTTVEDVIKAHDFITTKAKNIVATKGHDYSGHDKNDTFFNFRLCERIGLISTEEGILVRMCDKLSRLIAFSRQQNLKHESLEDTIIDLINYTIYLYIIQTEENKDGR